MCKYWYNLLQLEWKRLTEPHHYDVIEMTARETFFMLQKKLPHKGHKKATD